MADPHVRIFDGRAFLYAGWDALNSSSFVMPSWHIYSSDDLVTWALEDTIEPTQTYMGASTACWATDAAYFNGSYHFFFSNHNIDIGVLRSDSPVGPWVDNLKRPLFPSALTGYKQYDPTVLIDDGTPYIIFGLNDATSFYFCARLSGDMQGLAESPKRVTWSGQVAPGDDKPTLHKYNDTYYLSSGAIYSTASSVYGPWTYRGSTSPDARFGLQGQAHGNFFEFRGQWFHVWCEFVVPNIRWRTSWMTFTHYRLDGSMVDDEAFLSISGSSGVGSYDATWSAIEAEWFMAAEGVETREGGGGASGFAAMFSAGGWAEYPRVRNLPTTGSSRITLSVGAIPTAGAITVHLDTPTGTHVADCAVPVNSSPANVTCVLSGVPAGGVASLVLVSSGGGLSLDYLSFSS